jgi:Flp pilus assembly protein TadB
VNDPQTTVLYVLTTLAQSCAALAAFVGAVGVFRIQMLREQRQRAEIDLRDVAQKLVNVIFMDMHRSPTAAVLQRIDEERRKQPTHPSVIEAMDARRRWETFRPQLHSTRSSLLALEGWNLAVIAAALICFNCVSALSRAPWLSGAALVVVAVITALVPLGCVWVWTQGVEK